MAAPIITSVTVNPDPVPPGETATIEVTAYDPDEGAFTVTGTVTDTAGNATTFTATVTCVAAFVATSRSS